VLPPITVVELVAATENAVVADVKASALAVIVTVPAVTPVKVLLAMPADAVAVPAPFTTPVPDV